MILAARTPDEPVRRPTLAQTRRAVKSGIADRFAGMAKEIKWRYDARPKDERRAGDT